MEYSLLITHVRMTGKNFIIIYLASESTDRNRRAQNVRSSLKSLFLKRIAIAVNRLLIFPRDILDQWKIFYVFMNISIKPRNL